MGCDIHIVIEHKGKRSEEWNSFACEIRGEREYSLFGLMSNGVRATYPESINPRGLPIDCSSEAFDLTHEYIDDENRKKLESDAERGYVKYVDKYGHGPSHVTNSDYHSHSWLTADELLFCFTAFENRFKGSEFYSRIETNYWFILEVLRCYEKNGRDARIVFWFDN
jgi:hypothetical protein